jgi:predicted nucleic acid-binding protein
VTARGRPPLARGVYSLEAPTLAPPNPVFLDTSFVVDALITTQPNHRPCQAFLLALAEAGSTVYFNRLLEMELAETAFRLALIDRFGKKHWLRARSDGRARIRAGRLMGDVQQAWEATLDAFSFVRIELHEVAEDVPALMQRYGLKSYDAVHAASALFAGIETMVSLDVDFARLPASQLRLVTNSARLAACRQHRSH